MDKQNDEFLSYDLDDERAIAYIRAYVPQEQKERFTDDEYLYLMDLIEEYCVKSGLLDGEPDAEGNIDVDLDPLVDYIIKEARKDKVGEYAHDEVLFVVQGYMDYLETLDEE